VGYKIHRITKKFCDCRPAEYRHSQKLPRPHSVCNNKCPYFIFCNPEVNNMTIGEKLRKIRLITQRPYHLFQYLGEEQGIMLILEGEDSKKTPRLSFRGKSILDAISSAEGYIGKEMNVGAIQSEENKPEDVDGVAITIEPKV
jgi:hypothetical protein